MKKIFFTFILIFSILLSGCGLFKSTTAPEKKKSYAFIYNYEQERVWKHLIKVLDEMRFRAILPEPLKYELSTEKTVLNKDDIDTFMKLKEIGDIPKSPLSSYFEANYHLTVILTPEDDKTGVEIENNIRALERGRYNNWIDIKSNGSKEKEVLALLLKRLKESE